MDRYITTLLLFKELTEFLLPGNSKEAATLANPEEESDEAKESEADPVEVISSYTLLHVVMSCLPGWEHGKVLPNGAVRAALQHFVQGERTTGARTREGGRGGGGRRRRGGQGGQT